MAEFVRVGALSEFTPGSVKAAEVDGTRIGVRWQRRKAIGARPVILVFGMRKAQLYSFWFE